MSGIGGPGGIGGPKGPSGPGGPSDVDGPDDVADVADVERTAGSSGSEQIDALAAELAAGRLTPREAIDRLVEATATPDMDPAERAELRELLADLVANDPHLSGLANRVG
jgi:hypothetical protein